MAIVTCAEFPDLCAEEQELVPRLRARGVDVQAVPWDRPDVAWDRFESVVLRSTWDYFKRIEDFRAWLDRLEQPRVRLFNPLELVRWNFDKRYLRELELRGTPIVPTAFVEPGQRTTLAALLAERGWERAVFKPAISGGAHRTWSLDRAEASTHEAEFQALLASMAVLVQPFAPEIVEDGEWSLLFFESSFSHAVRKVPAPGDFRVQSHFGAAVTREEPSAELRAQAQRVVDALPVAPLYARIDGIRRGGAFLLMEVEVIEPYLYLGFAMDRMEGFIDALARTCSP
jgi:glutathione synthase/RimK-type ligase-like ATP-grasp enzyme